MNREIHKAIEERAFEIHEWRLDYECPYCEKKDNCKGCELQDWLESEEETLNRLSYKREDEA